MKFLLLAAAFLVVSSVEGTRTFLTQTEVRNLLPPNRKTDAQDVKTLFQRASENLDLFGDAFGYNEPRDQGVDLCHVVSWNFIDTYINSLPKGSAGVAHLRSFIRFITLTDDAAVVWRLDHTDHNNNNIPEKAFSHKRGLLSYNRKILLQLNDEIKVKALALAGAGGWPSTANLKEIKNLLHSAPANLRYGVARVNRSIGSSLDPLGTSSRRLTYKEYVTTSKNLPYRAPSSAVPSNLVPLFKTTQTTLQTKSNIPIQKTPNKFHLIVSSSVFGDPPSKRPRAADQIYPLLNDDN